MSQPPRVSVVVPAYLSHATVARSIEHLRAQSFRNFETVLVDSSPDGRTSEVVKRFPEVKLIRSDVRLLPHAARNLGVEHARGKLIVFTDPDVYADPSWLASLVETYDATSAVIVGALACHGRSLRDRGIHLCKFSKFLPAGSRREVDVSPTANLLVSKEDFRAAGGFAGDHFLADVGLGRDLVRIGKALVFEPRAIVAHHHDQSLRAFLRERYTRGKMYGAMRAAWIGGPLRIAGFIAASVLPVRLARVMTLVASHAAAGGEMVAFVVAFPIVLVGHAASLLGEAVGMTRFVLRREG